MKALFINGSPRKKRTTFKMLDSAMQGVSEAGQMLRSFISMKSTLWAAKAASFTLLHNVLCRTYII